MRLDYPNAGEIRPEQAIAPISLRRGRQDEERHCYAEADEYSGHGALPMLIL
jgi:hypothetical protein